MVIGVIVSMTYSDAINIAKDKGFAHQRVHITKSLIADQESLVSKDKYVYAGHN